MVHFDEILESINGFGFYQKTRLALACLLSLQTPILTYVYIFITPNLDHICTRPYSTNDSIQMKNDNIDSNQCSLNINGTVQKCTSWEFDKTHYRTTLTEDWSLVCDYNFLRAKIQTVFFFGFLFGSPILGKLSDTYGRRPVVLASVALINIGCFYNAFGIQEYFGFRVSYVLFILSAFMNAIATRGIDESCYVLAQELIGSKSLGFASIMMDLFYAIAHLLLGITAYFIRDWRNLNIAIYILAVTFLSAFILLPESPRWLISKNKTDEAFEVLSQIAKQNKRKLCNEKWEKFCLNHKKINENIEVEKFKDVLKYPRYFTVILPVIMLWLVGNVVFFGLGLKTNDLGVSPHLSFSIAAIFEIIAVVFTFFFINKIGRRHIYFLSMFVGGLCSISTVFIERVEFNMILVMVFKMATTVSYTVMRLFSSELFPTTIRVTSISICAVLGRIPLTFVPALNQIGESYWKPLPFLIYGILGLIGALNVLLLPETINRTVPENLKEFNESFKSKKHEPEGFGEEFEESKKLTDSHKI